MTLSMYKNCISLVFQGGFRNIISGKEKREKQYNTAEQAVFMRVIDTRHVDSNCY